MLFERITEDEKAIIEIFRHDYCDSSEFFTGEFVDTQTFLRFWEKAKTPLAEAFGDRLIVKKPITVMLEDDELYDRMHKIFWSSEYSTVRDNISYLVELYNHDAYSSRVISGERGMYYSLFEIINFQLFNEEAWVANRYDGPTCEIKVGNGNVIKLMHGCKVMKIIGRLARACGGDIAEQFEVLRLRQSQVLNEARISADLCISIHPLDYMTASYNSNDWRSCMCWEDGEYRRGVIEMMNSPMVVVAYLESKNEELTWFHDGRTIGWNSKKWREFFIVTNDMISGIKGYPYWNRAVEDEVITWLRELVMRLPDCHSNFSTKIYSWDVNNVIIDPEWDVEIAPTMCCGPAMYNDFYSDNEYHAVFAKGAHGDGSGMVAMNMSKRCFYSGESECVVCGKTREEVYFDGEGEIVCNDCLEHYTCCKCGDHVYYRNDLCEVDGLYYCRYCYERLENCNVCDRLIDPDNDEDCIEFCVGWDEYNPEVSTTHSYDNYEDIMRETDNTENYADNAMVFRSVCYNCANEIFKKGTKEFSEFFYSHKEYYRWYTVIPLSHFTEKGLEILFSPELITTFKTVHETKTMSA